jgi:carbonic anhydrase/acetyltransferase-like protein (isoleucine patch superfamily)
VTVGTSTALLDNCLVAGTRASPAVIGSHVTVMPGAVVRGATVGDGAMIGMGAVVQPGARIGADAFVDAGAVVPPGTVVPSGSLWTGSPARQLRRLTADEVAYLRSSAAVYSALSARHVEQWKKTPEALEDEAEEQLLKRELGLAPTDKLPVEDADVTEYFKLTHAEDSAGLFRPHEYNVAAETAAREAEEVAADAEENARYAHMGRLRRVGAAAKQLAALRPDKAAARDQLLADTAALDPHAADMLKDLVGRITAATKAGDVGAKQSLVDSLKAIDPAAKTYTSQAEATAAAEAWYAALANHAKALSAGASGSTTLPPAGGAGAAGAATRLQ